MSQSVIADHAEATGTLRRVDPVVRARLRGAIERIAAAAAEMLELGCEFTWADEMPAIVNDPGLTRLAHALNEGLVGAANTRTLTQTPIGHWQVRHAKQKMTSRRGFLER